MTARAEEQRTLKIMPAGDSITAGYFVGKGGYRNILRDELMKEGMRVEFVGRSTDKSDGIPDPGHEGYSGYTIRMIGEKADEALDKLKPDVILLFAGTNDIRVNGTNDQPSHPDHYKTAASRLDSLLELIKGKNPTAVVFVGTLMPFAKTWAEREAAAKEFNAQVADIVARRKANGGRVHLVDFRKTVTEEDLADGLHPNDKGYDKMAKAWAKAIKEANVK